MSIVLQGSTSGSCTLQEQAIAGTTVLTLPTTSGTLITTASSGQSIPKAALPTGSVLQVVQTAKTDTFSTTSSSFVDITGLTVSITPTSATSKILVIAQVSSSGMNGNSAMFKLAGGNTSSYIGNASGSAIRSVVGGGWQQNLTNLLVSQSLIYLDSPATTSSTTYSVQCTVGGSTGNPVQINYSIGGGGTNTVATGASSIIVMEIAA